MATLPPKKSAKLKVQFTPDDVVRVTANFSLLAEPQRFRVLLFLAQGERDVPAICEHLDQAQSPVSRHLALLRHAGLVDSRREGQVPFYSLTTFGVRVVRAARLMVDRSP